MGVRGVEVWKTGCGMDFCTGLENLPSAWRGAAVTIGNFDGAHRGHQRLIEHLCDVAARQSSHGETPDGDFHENRGSVTGVALVVTFDPPPGTLLAKHGPVTPPLTDLAEKIRLLRAAGADGVVVLRTTPELLTLPPKAFFEQILMRGIGVTAIVEGSDFRFGAHRAGTIETLHALGERNTDHPPISIHVVPPLRLDDHGREPEYQYSDDRLGEENAVPPVSSSRVRHQILMGDVAAAARMLGRPYTLRGVVVHGEERGRTLGYPTANLADIATLLPLDGVYAARVRMDGDENDHGNGGDGTGEYRLAAVAIGPNVTFGGAERKCEIHLIDFDGNLYGRTLRVELVDRIRGMQRFDSVVELLDRMTDDLRRIRAIASEN